MPEQSELYKNKEYITELGSHIFSDKEIDIRVSKELERYKVIAKQIKQQKYELRKLKNQNRRAILAETIQVEDVQKILNLNNSKEGFVSIYEVASCFENANQLACQNERNVSKFIRSIEQLPNIRKAVGKDAFPLYHIKDIKRFVQAHISIGDLEATLNITKAKVRNLIRRKGLEFYNFGKGGLLVIGTYINVEEVMKCLKLEHLIKKNQHVSYDNTKYISIYEISKKYFNTTSACFAKTLKEFLKKGKPRAIITKELEGPYFDLNLKRLIDSIYSIESVEVFFDDFFQKYISKRDTFLKMTKMKRGYLDYWPKVYEKVVQNEIVFGKSERTYTNVFITVEDSEKVKNTIIKEYEFDRKDPVAQTLGVTQQIKILDGATYISAPEVKKLLQLGRRHINKLVDEGSLTVHLFGERIRYMKLEQVLILLEEQEKLIKDYSENYYTLPQIEEKYTPLYAHLVETMGRKGKIKYIKIAPLGYRPPFFSVVKCLYEKLAVDKYFDEYDKEKRMLEVSIKNPYDEFVYKTESIMCVDLGQSRKVTKKAWYAFVKSKLDTTRAVYLKEQIHQYVYATENIASVFEKEVFKYTSEEINEKFLKEGGEIPKMQQKIFYLFLTELAVTFHSQGKLFPINLASVNNPKEYKEEKQENPPYTLNEYHDIYRYVANTTFHKKRAIKSVKQFIKSKNSQSYDRYDGVWLYTIVQLTNNWRHGTVVSQIPRINLSDTSIESLDWLLSNDPTIEDAKSIIYQIGRFVTHINKNDVKAENIFHIGEPLQIAFATAIAICEFRERETFDNIKSQDNSNPGFLVRLSDKEHDLATKLTKTSKSHRAFFDKITRSKVKENDSNGQTVDEKNMEQEPWKDFLFQNRRMNKTYSTLVWSVLRHLGKGLKEVQISRSHLTPETAKDYYIILSDEQVQRLVEDLFAKDSFGYATKLLSEIMFGIDVNKEEERESMMLLREEFGSPIKVEATAGFLQSINKRQEDVRNYLQKMSFDELNRLYLEVTASALYSKQENYQCIYRACKYVDEYGNKPDCDGCPASVINIYALSQLMDNYINIMKLAANDEFDNKPLGEKRRRANQLELIQRVVKNARQKFGKEVVNGFVPGGTDYIRALGGIINAKKVMSYRTLTDSVQEG